MGFSRSSSPCVSRMVHPRTFSQLDTTVGSTGVNMGQHPCGMLSTACRTHALTNWGCFQGKMGGVPIMFGILSVYLNSYSVQICAKSCYYHRPRDAYGEVIMVKLLIVYLFLVPLCFFFSLHCWEGPISNKYTVRLHLLFTKHVTNTIWFDLINAGRSSREDTVSKQGENDEVDRGEHSPANAPLGLYPMIHHRIPVLSCQNLGDTNILSRI
jgi:hypothetical protein